MSVEMRKKILRPSVTFLVVLGLLGSVNAKPYGSVLVGDVEPVTASYLARTLPSNGTTIVEIATSPDLPNVMVVSLKSLDSWLPPQYSLDGGITWREVATVPWQSASVTDMHIAVAPRTDQSMRLLVAVKAADKTGLYRTGDRGATWANQEIPGSGDNFDELVASPADPLRLYLARRTDITFPDPAYVGYALTSDDAGLSWAVIKSDFDMHYTLIVPSPSIATRVYLYRYGYSPGWFQSDDAGENWTPTSFPILELAVDSQDPLWLYGLASGLSGAISGRSSDGGVAWTPWEDKPSDFGQLLAHPTKSHVIFLRCAQGLYRSDDAGDQWEQLSSLQGDLLAPDYGVPGRLLWARTDGLWASTDDGIHWVPLPFGWTDKVFLPLAIR